MSGEAKKTGMGSKGGRVISMTTTARSMEDIERVARLIWLSLNDQGEVGTFGYQDRKTQDRYLKAAFEVCAFLAPGDVPTPGPTR